MKSPFRLLGALVSFCLLSFPGLASAGGAWAGLISNVHVFDTGVVIFSSSGTRYGVPACAASTNRFVIDASTAGGKAQLAGLLAAYHAGKAITVLGNGTCTIYFDSESVTYFLTAD